VKHQPCLEPAFGTGVSSNLPARCVELLRLQHQVGEELGASAPLLLVPLLQPEDLITYYLG